MINKRLKTKMIKYSL